MIDFKAFLLLCVLPLFSSTDGTNILVIVADDLGYNDISWHNPDIISPNLDKLAKDGIAPFDQPRELTEEGMR